MMQNYKKNMVKLYIYFVEFFTFATLNKTKKIKQCK